jgi:methionyl-tRNA formyltransferase
VLNITILANRDLASNWALNCLLPELARKHRLRVYLSDAVGGTAGDKEPRPEALRQLRFFEQTLFNECLFPLIDASGEPGELLTFKGLEACTGEPITTLNKVNSPESLDRLRAAAPDLFLSIRYGGILREQAIAIPPLGVINLHSGLLPDYRGVMATFRALLAGDREIGTTIHYITDPGIDTGDVITGTRLAVQPGRSYLWHVLALYPPACEKLLACVAELDRGESLATHPQPGGGCYFSFPDEGALSDFSALGHRLVDMTELTAITTRYSETLQRNT